MKGSMEKKGQIQKGQPLKKKKKNLVWIPPKDNEDNTD